MASLDEPPFKKQKISPTKSIPCNSNNPSSTISPIIHSNNTKTNPNTDKEEEEEEEYYYTLHVNEDIILISTDPNVPCNTNYDFDDNNGSDPNLFIVKGISSTYNVSKWLNYHTNIRNDIQLASSLLFDSDVSLLIITGAGMGCDSNLPDYRSSTGFWNDYKPFKNIQNNSNLSLYDMSKTDWFNNDPLSAWGFYTHRSILYRDAVPHDGYNILLNTCNTNGNQRDYYYMTSNIDGQVIKSGFNLNKIYQTHGSLHYIQCIKFCDNNSDVISFNNEYNNLDFNKNTFKINNINNIPSCNKCGSLMRPNVSFFSDSYDTFNGNRMFKQKNKFIKWLKPFINSNDNNNNNKLLVIEIGCGKSIHSLRWESEYLKTLNNITLIRINPTENININDNKKSRHITLKLPAKLALEAIAKYKK